MKQITCILVGAGLRGMEVYAPYALEHPDELKFVAVAEPDPVRRERFAKAHNIPAEACFETWEDLLDKPKMADAAMIMTLDRMHFKPTMAAIEKGYHILLEKPMASTPGECVTIAEAARKSGKLFLLCYVLRYTPFFSTIKQLLDDGAIGKLISIQHNENVGYWHQAHSFVRGHYGNSEKESPMILQKSSHDMDIMLWLAGKDCERLSSFGSLSHFTSENAPAGAPLRCTDGCPHIDTCIYSAPALYLTDNIKWPTSAISNFLDYESRLKALKEGPYGRCVYHCDNDVVDHQVVSLEFGDGITAAFTMCAFTNEISRTIKLMGTEGEIRGAMEKDEIRILRFGSRESRVISLKGVSGDHSGGDIGLMKEFVRLMQADGNEKGRSSAEKAIQSNLMAFAAEESRLTNKVIDMDEYYKRFI